MQVDYPKRTPTNGSHSLFLRWHYVNATRTAWLRSAISRDLSRPNLRTDDSARTRQVIVRSIYTAKTILPSAKCSLAD